MRIYSCMAGHQPLVIPIPRASGNSFTIACPECSVSTRAQATLALAKCEWNPRFSSIWWEQQGNHDPKVNLDLLPFWRWHTLQLWRWWRGRSL